MFPRSLHRRASALIKTLCKELIMEFKQGNDNQAVNSARVVVCGASSELGQDICQRLSNNGYSLLLLGRNLALLEQIRGTLPGEHQVAQVDLNEPDSLTEHIIANATAHGPFQGAVQCAGVHQMTPLRSTCYADFERMFRINTGGALALLQAFTRKKVRAAGAPTSVVLLSSVSQSQAEPAVSGYAASKAAMAALCRSAALELAKDQVLVNCIAAGMIKTPLNNGYAEVAAEAISAIENKHPLGFGQPGDISDAVLYLLQQNRWSTGSTLYVDGGFSCRA
ncbi:oxidoreductase [Pseudoalteromonas rubra]|uniref:Oxidoreductase n=2 Tax=Pseudoalteromonas rubra TaxID=43658 RepID=A0A5S3WRH8_9GAMM|nr:oxidoreductase [Pseudoalteromonas rubra]TMP34173.1 oxidoreductase [Pseudoalteromonas rubra]